MEPVSVLLATGAVAVYAAHRAEKMSDKLRRGPTTLPDMMSEHLIDDASMLVVIAVHIRHATLSAALAGKPLQMCVKYGQPGDSIKCVTHKVTVPKPGRPVAANFVARKPEAKADIGVDFGTTCLFLGHRQFESRVRFRLNEAGVFGTTVAKAELDISPPWSRVEENRLILTSAGAKAGAEPTALGQLDVTVEMRAVAKGSLRQCLKVLDAETQQGAFLTGTTPVSDGVLENDVWEYASETTGELLQGLPVDDDGDRFEAIARSVNDLGRASRATSFSRTMRTLSRRVN